MYLGSRHQKDLFYKLSRTYSTIYTFDELTYILGLGLPEYDAIKQAKTLHTLNVLMSLMQIGFHYVRLEQLYKEKMNEP